ncbi:MAG: YitT family protein [Culicoidibacterales bacterium]
MKKKSNIKNMGELIVGALLLAISLKFFIIPTGISAGGASGFATILHSIFGWNISIVVWIINAILLIAAGMLIGRDIVLKSIIGSFIFPVFLAILPNFDITNGDPLLGMICGGALTGVASYLIFSSGGSTGGTSLPPFFLKKYFNISLVTGLTIIDTISVGANLLTGSYTNVFYGIIAIFITKLVADYLETGIQKRKAVHIITEEVEQISSYIHNNIGRGTTQFKALGGYSQNNKTVILTIVNMRELHLIREKILAIDEYAFMIVGSVSEVHGQGFTKMQASAPDMQLELLDPLTDM